MPLIEDAVERLSLAMGEAVVVTTVIIQHHERAVFETLLPEGPVVVKVDTSVAKHRTEVSVLRAAGRAGLPVPAVVLSEEGPPSLLVLRRIDGIPLHRTVDGEAWRNAGRVLRQLHELTWPTSAGSGRWSGRAWPDHFRWWADHERDRLLRYQSLPAPVVHQLHSYLSTTFAEMGEIESRVLHGDCQADHYLVTPGSPRIAGILDFGDAVLGDPVWDLAILSLGVPEKLSEVRLGYEPDEATERRTQELLVAYQLIRRLGSASWMREHGRPHGPDLKAALDIVALQGWVV